MGFPYTPGEQAGYPAVIQQVADYLQGAENPAIFMGIQASGLCLVHPRPALRRRGSTGVHVELL